MNDKPESASGVSSPSTGLLADLPAGVRKSGNEYARHGISLWRHMKRDPRFKDWDDESLVMAITMMAWETGFKAALKAMLREFPPTPLEKCRGTYPEALDKQENAATGNPVTANNSITGGGTPYRECTGSVSDSTKGE